jgi:hypothetical protein
MINSADYKQNCQGRNEECESFELDNGIPMNEYGRVESLKEPSGVAPDP